MGKINEIGKIEVIGCIDPLAFNYNPLATISCGPNTDLIVNNNGTYSSGCCSYYDNEVVGCIDPLASNYNINATKSCTNCCKYVGKFDIDNMGNGLSDTIIFIPSDSLDETDANDTCSGLILTIGLDGIVYNSGKPLSEECCKKEVVGNDVSWDGTSCVYLINNTTQDLCTRLANDDINELELENRITCIDCDNFGWWNNLYTSLNGSSLQDENQDLWNLLVDVISSDELFSDGSFYVDTIDGNPILDEVCCRRLPNSNYVTILNDDDLEVGVCLCNTIQDTDLNCDCLKTLNDFSELAASVEGNQLLLNVDTLTSLGLSIDESVFVINNFFNPNDLDGDGVSEKTTARLLISNALYLTGGFKVCYERNVKPFKKEINNNLIPVAVTEEICTTIDGFWDGTLCYCKPLDQCNLTLRNIEIITSVDNFNQNVFEVTFGGEPLTRSCCLKIAEENNLPWVYKQYNGDFKCFKKDPNPCLPLEFNLTQELIKPFCDTPLNVSVSFYMATPDNPCVNLEPIDDDVIDVIIDEEPCLLTFDESNNIVDYNSPKLSQTVTSGRPFEQGTTVTEPCCFNPIQPIALQLVIRDGEGRTQHTSEQLTTTSLETWIDLTTQFSLPTTATTQGYTVALQVIDGLNCCCVYDIFLDNFKFECSENITIIDEVKNSCPGFELVPVIDNKKSWVYNPGKLNYSGILNQNGREIDNDIILNGDFGLISNYGEINRVFAPSPDAELPWRYTDYFNQSSVLEKHSNLVLNSKELYLTFDMCGQCCVEYEEITGNTTNELVCIKKLNLLQLENYKKTFQSFWVQFVEQFVPATTIFVSGEKWCNKPEDICLQYEECDFDFEFVEADVTIIPNTSEFNQDGLSNNKSFVYEPTNFSSDGLGEINDSLYQSTEDGPIKNEFIDITPLPKEPFTTLTIDSIIEKEQERIILKEKYLSKLQPTETIIE